MSAYREFDEAQQTLNIMFRKGHRITPDKLEALRRRLDNNINQMIIYNRRQINIINDAVIPTQTTTQPLTPEPTPSPRPIPAQAPYNPGEKSKVISKNMLEESCPQECAICQDTPKYKDAVCTECNHYYCKSCWTSWMNVERSNKKCPTCRKDKPTFTSFRARARRTQFAVEIN
jgi:hypothetical protein